MTSTYQPEQRPIAARLFTRAGWVTGTFHVPKRHSFLDFLNHGGPFFKLTEVRLPTDKAAPFFALRRAEVQLIVPSCEESDLQLSQPTGEHVPHSVCCLLQNGSLDGSLQVLKNVRFSDFLLHRSGFYVMRDCKTHEEPSVVTPIILVNTDQLVGVSEPGH